MSYLQEKFPTYEVVYGDTDSLFLRCPGLSEREAWDLMHVEADLMTKELFGDVPPMRFAPEKSFRRIIFTGPKHYAGVMHFGQFGALKQYFRGIEVVRRDWCPLVGVTMQKIFDCLFAEVMDVKTAVEHVRQVVTDLYAGRTEMHHLLLSQGLSKELSEYDMVMRHLKVVEKMKKRDADTAPKVGDRVTYVMVENKEKLASEHSEDPLFVLRNNLAIDAKYYVTKQLEPPITRVLTPVIGAEACHELFYGTHTQRRIIATPSAMKHFVVMSHPCVVCKVQTKQRPYCTTCRQDSALMAHHDALQRQKIADIEDLVAIAERHCRACQQIGPEVEIECEARDCPHLYTRIGRYKKLEEERKKFLL
jgi:DNA polymerase delta subunit 1